MDPLPPPGSTPGAASHAEREARAARSRVEELTQEVESLRAQLGRLHAIVEGLWTIVRSDLETGDDEGKTLGEEIARHLAAYDAVDRNVPSPCPDCGRPLAARSTHCVFCGFRRSHAG